MFSQVNEEYGPYRWFPKATYRQPLFIVIIGLILGVSASAARIKDLAQIKGVRNNQLTGYGLVVGLSGTGDKGFSLTQNSLKLALKGLGVDQKVSDIDTKNAASVFVSVSLPPFARMGAQLDVTISSIGSASSLDGGILMMTPLRGPDGMIYAMAQGKVVTNKRGGRQTQVTGQSLVTATVPGGAIVEREATFDFTKLKEIRYQLFSADFTTSARIAQRINDELGGRYAAAKDAGSVEVVVPLGHTNPVELVALIENIEVEADRRAKVVIDQRTGTVIFGSDVTVAPVAIAHNNLRIEVRELASVGAKGPGQQGEDVTKEQKVMMFEKGSTIADVVSGLNAMGASADDLVSLVHSLKSSGALMAEVIVQ